MTRAQEKMVAEIADLATALDKLLTRADRAGLKQFGETMDPSEIKVVAAQMLREMAPEDAA